MLGSWRNPRKDYGSSDAGSRSDQHPLEPSPWGCCCLPLLTCLPDMPPCPLLSPSGSRAPWPTISWNSRLAVGSRGGRKGRRVAVGRGDSTLAAESGGPPQEAWSWWNRPLGGCVVLGDGYMGVPMSVCLCALCVAVTSVPLSLSSVCICRLPTYCRSGPISLQSRCRSRSKLISSLSDCRVFFYTCSAPPRPRLMTSETKQAQNCTRRTAGQLPTFSQRISPF